MKQQFKTETNKSQGLIIPKIDVHKKCKEEIAELKFMITEHLKVCKMKLLT